MWNIWRRKRNGEIEVENNTTWINSEPKNELLQDIKQLALDSGMDVKLIPLVEKCKVYFERVIPNLMDNYDGWAEKPSTEEFIRYFFMKAMEHQVSYTLYNDSKRQGAFDVFLSPDEISETSFRTNLPNHLDNRIKQQVPAIDVFAKAVKEYMAANPEKSSFDIMMSVVTVGCSYAETLKIADFSVKRYKNKDMLTVNELRIRGIETAAEILFNSGYYILEIETMLDSYVSLRLHDGKNEICAFADVQVYPVKNHFLKRELDHLMLMSMGYHAVPYYLCVSVASQDPQHFEDGVLLANDGTRARIDAFEPLELDPRKLVVKSMIT